MDASLGWALPALLIVIVVLLVAVVGLALVVWRRAPPADPVALLQPGLQAVTSGLERTERTLRDDVGQSARGLREEVGGQLQALLGQLRSGQQELLSAHQQSTSALAKDVVEDLARLHTVLQTHTTQTGDQLLHMREGMVRLGVDLTAQQQHQLTELLARLSAALHELAAGQREEAAKAAARLLSTLQELVVKIDAAHATQRQDAVAGAERLALALKDMTTKIEAAAAAQREQALLMQDRVTAQLKSLQESNEQKLEQMRLVVDEKLQGTLETRIGEAFKLVSDRLEQVHRGLGEMQTLATGVGDLKKVLTNVKNRGTWGEMQLGLLLSNMLAPQQYETNVAVVPGKDERVEFAVRMPSHGHDTIWLSIDSKFPIEAWQRLVEAGERGDLAAVAEAEKQLKAEVLRCAADIQRKYIAPPHTVDHAILFVPTESLYAEVARQPLLLEELVMKHSVVIAGPVTLSALLASLQMAYRTATLHQRSEDIFQLLGKMKTEMGQFEELFRKLKKKLQEATNNVELLERRRRVVSRALRDVEAAPVPLLPAAGDRGDSAGEGAGDSDDAGEDDSDGDDDRDDDAGA